MMINADEYELNLRRNRMLSYYQKHLTTHQSLSYADTSSHIEPQATTRGRLLGRTVIQVDSTTRSHQSYANSSKEDRLLNQFVNTVKKGSDPNTGSFRP